MERRPAVILAGDVVGYSRLMAEDQTGTYDRLRAGVREVVVPGVERHGGRVFKTTGDGFLAVFASAGEALSAAVTIQDGFADRPLALRIGINLGDVIEENGDLFGDGVNVAARLEAMAEPGTTYASAAVVRGAGGRPDLRIVRLGRRRGKNLPEPIETYLVERAGAARAWPLRRLAKVAAAVPLLVAIGLGWHFADPLRDAIVPLLPHSVAAVAGVADNRPAVAVLPFDNLGGDASRD